MPLGRKATDVLWQFLCPISRENAQKCLIGSLRRQLHPIHIQSLPKRPRIGSRSLLQSVNLQARCYIVWKPNSVTRQARDRERVRDLDIPSAYQELRKLVLEGNYTHIRHCVKILVKERGEKPNLRLYDALLLANTDNQYGSAGEVARIFDDVAAQGLTPDSATYHAALRVWECSRKGQICFGLRNTGSCNTSRLLVEATHTRRTTPTMVLFDRGRLARCYHGPSQRAAF